MRVIAIFFSIIAIILSPYGDISVVHASSTSVVISQLQTGGSGSGTAGQEFIEIYNNSAADVDASNWCLTYSSASDVSQSTVACLPPPDSQTHIWLKAKSFATFVSPDYKMATGFAGDGTFSYVAGMSGTAGHVRLVDASKNEIDKVAWGPTTVVPSEITTPAPAGGKALQRVGTGVLQDNDNNAIDFGVFVTPVLHTSGLYEVVTIIDMCPNIDGAQTTVPTSMVIDASGNCVYDTCPNIDGIQTEVPYGDAKDDAGNCVYDACLNINGVQATIPPGYESPDSYNCNPRSYIIDVTELLPNPAGDDNGNEFVELYNPNLFPVDLDGYTVQIGSNFDKTYTIPSFVLQPGGYLSLNNLGSGFALVNTQSRVRLVAPAGNNVSETPLYSNPLDGESWALIGMNWQYTNQPTFGAPNLASLAEETAVVDDTDTGLASCPAGKYRNPLTNRCRSIESDASVLTSCDADQYRNPETGRCRKITLAGDVTACKDSQYRSEETNRCRNIVTASTQKPCKDTQFRSEETGRCRNLPATGVPSAAFAVQPVKETGLAFVGWWALGGVSLLAVGYGAWEWRREVAALWQRSIGRFGSK